MDAIKGSPATPLAASKPSPSNGTGSWAQSKVDRSKRDGVREDEDDEEEAGASDSDDSDGDDESDSQDSDEDGDSGDSETVNGSGSDSEGSESESCSWTDSDSDSGSSSCSSRSGHSSRSSHTHQTFSIRETNFEQGGLKLKISAMKVTKKGPARDSDPKKNAVSQNIKVCKEKAKAEKSPNQCPSLGTVQPPVSKAAVKANATKRPEVVRRKPRGGRTPHKEKVSSVAGRSLCNMRVPASPTLYGCTATGLSRGRTQAPHTPRSNTDTDEESDSDDDEEVAEISQIAQELGHIEQENIAISEHLQEINQEDLAAILPDVVTTDNHGDEAGPPFDGFEDVSSESGKVAGDGNGNANSTQRGAESSSDMELPEQVVSEAIKRIHIDSEEVGGRGADSSSDGDSCEEEGGFSGAGEVVSSAGYSSSLLQQFVEKTEILASQAACSQDPGKVGVLTRAKREEPRRRKRGRPPKLARKVEEGPETTNQTENSSGTAKCLPELEAYMRLDCSVSNVSPDSGIQSVAGSPVHQSCSPASHMAIHSPSSQAHKVASPVSSPHSMREATPPLPTLFPGEERQGPIKRGPGRPPRNSKVARRGPGRPKGSGKKAKVGQLVKVAVTSNRSGGDSGAGVIAVSGTDSCDEIPPTPSPVPIVPIKRGPGRPKKAPPVLEPNLPISLPEQKNKRDGGSKSPIRKKGGGSIKASEDIESRLHKSEVYCDASVVKPQYKSSAMLSEICERVSKRLDQPTNLPDTIIATSEIKKLPAKSPKAKASRDPGPQKRSESSPWPKSNKGRRKREKDDGGDTERPAQAHVPKQRHLLNSTSSPTSISRKTIVPRAVLPRVLGLPPGISHHRHKKRKKKPKPPRVDKNIVDPAFLMDLEKLAQEFSRCCIITKGGTPVVTRPGEVSLPSIFRVKRIVKKRKGSEKSRASDRESGTEGDGGKEKSRQRRPKKNAVETPKGHERPEANNEQRLPLKKRHYHISTAASLQATSSSPETPRNESSSDGARKAATSERTISIEKEKLSDKGNIGNSSGVVGKSQSKASDKVAITCKEKPSDKGNCLISGANKNNSIVEVKSKSVSELPRNSIDEAIEACITRYTTVSPPLEKISVATRSVIVTPKKRHRLENATVVCGNGRTPCVTTCKGKDNVTDNVGVNNNNNNKNLSSSSNIPQPGKRVGSRSASINSSTTSSSVNGANTVVVLPTVSSSETKPLSIVLELSSKCSESDQSISVNTVVKPSPPSSIKVTSPSSKMVSVINKPSSPGNKAAAPTNKVTSPVIKVMSLEKKVVPAANKVTQPASKAALPSTKATSPASKVSSPASKSSTPVNKVMSPVAKVASSPASKVISPTTKVSPPTSKVSPPVAKVVLTPVTKATITTSKAASSPASKMTATPKTVSSPTSKATSGASKVSASPVNKVAATVSKTASPPTSKGTSIATKAVASPTSKGSLAAAKRAASPASKVSPVPAKSAASPASKLSLSPAGKATSAATKMTLSGKTYMGNKVIAATSKTSTPTSRATSTLNKISPSRRVVTPTGKMCVSARRSVALSNKVTSATKVGTPSSKNSVSKVPTPKPISKINSALRSIEENIPVFHNLRAKRVNGSTERDELVLKRNKKKKLIRDVRVHVTKLSHMELLKKAVGAVKERARRRKSINRTGFPVKKKKKKRPPLLAHIMGLPSPVENTSSTHVQTVNESTLPTSFIPVINLELKSISSSAEKSAAVSNEEAAEPVVEIHQLQSKNQSGTALDISSKSKGRRADCLKTEPAEVTLCSDLKPKEITKRDRLCNLLQDRSNREEDDTDTESDVIESKPLGSCKRYKGERCRMLEDRTDEELSVCATEDLSALQMCDNRTRGKRKRDSSHDELGETQFSQLPSKRSRKCRDDDTDRDDISDMILPYESLPCSDVPSGDESTKSCRRKKQPRWRKKFLAAGLFSDYYKEDEPRRPHSDTGKSRLLYRPEEHQHGLLPSPYHCGKYLRQRRVEFKLPYDLWWLHTHSQLPGRDRVPSWNYKKIRTNVYYDVKPTYTYEAQACNCALPAEHSRKGCGEDCINRMVYAECSPQLCPCKDLCSNQRIQRHEWAPGLDKFMTKDKGWGVKTKYAIKSGEFILEYVGEVVSEKEFKDRMASRYMSDTHHYCLNLDGGLVIDGHRMGGDGRFVNHSCEPNCEMQKWSVNGLFRMALFALRDIQPHEELSYDYNFSLFNPAEGQPCKCGSVNCRGVIGGKSQRVNGSIVPPEDKGERRLVGRPRKNARKNSSSSNKLKYKKRLGEGSSSQKHSYMTPVKPMSHQQRCFAQVHHCFLLRNLEKVKRLRERLKQASRREQPLSCSYPRPQVKQSDVFLTQLNALSTPRNIRTRRLAQAEDNPELTRTARLAYVFRDLYNIVVAAKDERTDMLCAPFLTLPSKRKLPQYYQRISDPIDLGTLEQNIVTGYYRTVESFDQDMSRLFSNNVRFFGRTSELGITAARLRKVYNEAKLDFLAQLEEILGESPPASFIPEHDPGGEEEDVIRCICGLYKDEGMMIQCERCLVWQHCDCVRADEGIEHYLCEQCSPRPVDLEIVMSPQPHYATPGLIYYITLLRGTLQLRQGDTVYVLRDMIEENAPKTSPPTKHTYKTIKDFKYCDFDIFRIERLWKDEKGERFAFGHHYLRPHETYHEPSRKFFPNEVMRVPLYEVVPLDLIMGHCWVLDLNTFCKGRPVGAPEEHIYICEYRVDKSAHLFTKIAKPRHSVCTKTYAFETFDTRLKPQRTYTPHGPVAPRARGRSAGSRAAEEEAKVVVGTQPAPCQDEEEEMPLARVRDDALARKRASQKQRLNMILLRLLARLPSKQPLDLSFLLEPGRRHRKKTSILNP